MAERRPKTEREREKGRERSLAHLGQKGEPGAGLRHGMQSRLTLQCDVCRVRMGCDEHEKHASCAIEQRYVPARRKALLGLAHIDPEIDGPAIEQMIGLECRIGRGLRMIGYFGEMAPETDESPGVLAYQPMANLLTRLMEVHLRQLDALSLTPAGRVATVFTKGAAAEQLAAVRALFEDEDERKDDDDDG